MRKSFPRSFGERQLINTAVFLLNRLPTNAMTGQTPFEAWHGYKPLLKNLKIFGCLCFSHIPQPKRHKLDKKVEPAIFIGYSLQSKSLQYFSTTNWKKFGMQRCGICRIGNRIGMDKSKKEKLMSCTILRNELIILSFEELVLGSGA